MRNAQLNAFLRELIENMPSDWLRLTTHRLDIYDESQAKTQFLQQLEMLYQTGNASPSTLSELPTAFDYIRLGHPLSCVLEWALAKNGEVNSDQIIAFSSQVTPILAILRKNHLENKATRIYHKTGTKSPVDTDVFQQTYGYTFEVVEIDQPADATSFDGSTLYVSYDEITNIEENENIDFWVAVDVKYGAIIRVSAVNSSYISEIQHVRRRETIAMTPADCNTVLRKIVGLPFEEYDSSQAASNKASVQESVKNITGSDTTPLMGSSGLSIQYAIMMGIIDYANRQYEGKDIKVIIPPNCYGGTNDQARRVAACLDHVEVIDLPVDGGNDMVDGLDTVLNETAKADAVPFVIVEIPTNPRVEVPNLENLKTALIKARQTPHGTKAVDPIFVIDQTFCPNFHFLGDKATLSEVKTLSYVSGSKFPSGGLCTAGYVTSNSKGKDLMPAIEHHLIACDNEATHLQMEILAKQLPSMVQRIADAYANTRDFVDFISEQLPAAKINFVSETLANQGFTPSVFSLDLPTKGDSDEEREQYKRALNLKLINMMIEAIPTESKYCVSYGQLKGCYWTIPATSTQGTTKEGDKDYIARVALSPNLDLEKHKEVFADFVRGL